MKNPSKADVDKLERIIRDLDRQEAAMEYLYGSSAAYQPNSTRMTNIRNNKTLRRIHTFLVEIRGIK